MDATIEESVSKFSVDSMAIVLRKREDDIKAHVLVKLIGGNHVYEAVFKTPIEVLDPECPELNNFFALAEKHLTQVLLGNKELNAKV